MPGPALVCTSLEPFADHVMTTRPWALGAGKDGDADSAWAEVAVALDRPVVRVHQVHGVDLLVRRAGSPSAAAFPDADIIVTDDPSVAIAIQTADCAPILIADRRTGVVAAAHAGWRGLAAGVPRVVVEALAREFGSRPADLIAAAGPSIGACCYEVGADVRRRFADSGWPASMTAPWFFTRPQPTTRNPSMAGLPATPRFDHWYFDSSCAVRDQLVAIGIPADQIAVAELCTASHPDTLCSYRRDGQSAGRIAAAIRARSPRLWCRARF